MTMAIPEDLMNILGSDEKIEIYIKQKFFHPKFDIDSIAITNERIILRDSHTLGLKKNYVDYNYADLEKVIINRGIWRSKIQCTLASGGEPLSLDEIPNAEAEKAYVIIRENISKFKVAASPEGTAPQVIFCEFCGAKNKSGDIKCINCGASLNQIQS